jgi:hypothetical protein
MTASTAPTTRHWARYAVLLAPLIAGVAAGAYLDWLMWSPSSGIVVTIGAIGLLLVGALAWSSQWRPIRPAALWVAAFGIGILLGQNFGPSRPPITLTAGRVDLQLTEPAGAQPTGGRADCQLTPDGQNFAISGDPNVRIKIGDQTREEQDAVQISIARGDMWQYGEPRSDRWSLIVAVSDTGPFTEDDIPGLWFMESGPASELVATGAQAAGSIRFDGLVLDASQSQGADQPLDLSGTIEWTCQG